MVLFHSSVHYKHLLTVNELQLGSVIIKVKKNVVPPPVASVFIVKIPYIIINCI